MMTLNSLHIRATLNQKTQRMMTAEDSGDNDGSGDDDDEADPSQAGPSLAKLPRMDGDWSWKKCSTQRVQPPQLTVTKPEEVLIDLPDDPRMTFSNCI